MWASSSSRAKPPSDVSSPTSRHSSERAQHTARSTGSRALTFAEPMPDVCPPVAVVCVLVSSPVRRGRRGRIGLHLQGGARRVRAGSQSPMTSPYDHARTTRDSMIRYSLPLTATTAVTSRAHYCWHAVMDGPSGSWSSIGTACWCSSSGEGCYRASVATARAMAASRRRWSSWTRYEGLSVSRQTSAYSLWSHTISPASCRGCHDVVEWLA